MLKEYIKDGRLDFSALPEITPQVRDVFLVWLSRAFENKKREAKTEDGRKYRILPPESEELCEIKSSDGVFKMPGFIMEFEDE